MKRLVPFAAAMMLALSGVMLVGCETGNPSDGPYAGGNGAFGEDPANPGEYSGQRYQAASAHPGNNSQSSNSSSPYAGGNGQFGENPANPGEHSGQRFENSTGATPTTQPSSGSYQNH